MTEQFVLSNESIDVVSEKVGDFLKQEKAASKEIIRTKLMVEEVLLTYKDNFGDDTPFSVTLAKRFGRLYIDVQLAGASFDPLPSDDSTNILRNVLSGSGLVPTWQYKNGLNILSFTPRKKKPSQMLRLLLAVMFALLAGGVFSLLPGEWGTAVSQQLVGPLFDTFIGFLSALAGVTIFFSLVWGIISTDDLAAFEKIGKRLMTRNLLTSAAILAAYVLLVLPLFPISFANGSSFGMSELIGMVLDIVPDNFLTPFVHGNLMQIVFLSVLIGIALLMLGRKTTGLSSAIGQGARVVNLIMDWLGSFIPVLVFLSLFNMMLDGSIGEVLGSYKLLLLIVGGAVFSCLIYFVMCMRLKVRPLVLLKKLLPATIIALTTASSSAALPVCIKNGRKRLGIEKTLVNLSLSLYQVVFMVVTSIDYFIMVLCMSEMYGIAISPAMLVMAFVSIILLAIATPPTPGSGAAVLVILFSQFGIPPEAVAIAASVEILLDYIITASEVFCRQCEMLLLADSLDMIDHDTLKKAM